MLSDCQETSAGLLPTRMSSSPHEVATRNQLNTINGCYIPCLLNILGAVLFLSVGFAIGQMGFLGALGIFAFSEAIAYLTITSFSAIVTNGKMAAGGAYFMISRSLGPAFGGSSGILFWFTYCINVTFNTVAFTGTFRDTFLSKESWWGAEQGYWQQVIISSITLFTLYLVAYKGAGAFAKVNYFIFAALAVAIMVVMGSLFISRAEFTLPSPFNDSTIPYSGNFAPWSLSRLSDNMWPAPVPCKRCESAAMFGSGRKNGQVCTLQLVFSIVFPAVVGMMEGANLSGDLRNPGRSIPLGTWTAVSTAFLCYIVLIIGQAGTMNREALQFDQNVVQNSTVGHGYFVVLGVAAACLSTALGSMFGSARILQAIARDDIFPCLGFFKKGTLHGDEPRRAVTLSYLLAQAAIFLGDLDDVAPLLTNFFLLTYCLVNFACFLLIVSRVPNFRPTYRFYSWQTSLLGSIVILFVMFYLNWVYAFVTITIVVTILIYITVRFTGQKDWIDISQAVMFRWARRGLLTMQGQKQDPKYWRPSLLLLGPSLTGIVDNDGFRHLLFFLNKLKQSGLLVVGQALIGESMMRVRSGCSSEEEEKDFTILCDEQHRLLSEAVPGLEGFPQHVVAPNGRLAYQNLMMSAGLGTMVPDTVVVPLLQGRASDGFNLPLTGAEEFLQVLRDVLHLKKNLLLVTNFDQVEDKRCWLPRRRSSLLSVGHSEPSLPRGPNGLRQDQRRSSGPVEGATKDQRLDMWMFGDLQLPLSGVDQVAGENGVCDSFIGFETQLSLLLQLGQISRAELAGNGYMVEPPQLRLNQLAAALETRDPASEAQVQQEREAALQGWLKRSRIRRASTQVCTLPAKVLPSSIIDWPDNASIYSALNEQLRSQSSDALMVFALLPPPPTSPTAEVSQEYIANLNVMTAGLPPTVLAMNGQGFPVITTTI